MIPNYMYTQHIKMLSQLSNHECLSDVSRCMATNKLKLNPDKIEFVVLAQSTSVQNWNNFSHSTSWVLLSNWQILAKTRSGIHLPSISGNYNAFKIALQEWSQIVLLCLSFMVLYKAYCSDHFKVCSGEIKSYKSCFRIRIVHMHSM